MIKFIASIIFIMFTYGCASYTEPHTEALAKSETTYNSFSEFTYQPLATNEKKEFLIEPGYPVFRFETGKSYFLSLKIPDPKPSFVNITSRPIGQWIPTSHMLYPIALFLNEKFEVIQQTQPMLVHNPRFMHGMDFDSQTEIPPGAKYLVLHSVPAAYGQRVALFGAKLDKERGERTVSVPLAGGGIMFFNTPDYAESTTVGPTGRLWVEYSSTKLELPNQK